MFKLLKKYPDNKVFLESMGPEGDLSGQTFFVFTISRSVSQISYIVSRVEGKE